MHLRVERIYQSYLFKQLLFFATLPLNTIQPHVCRNMLIINYDRPLIKLGSTGQLDSATKGVCPIVTAD